MTYPPGCKKHNKPFCLDCQNENSELEELRECKKDRDWMVERKVRFFVAHIWPEHKGKTLIVLKGFDYIFCKPGEEAATIRKLREENT